MSVYQRYLSRSLIFFTGFFVIFLLFLESNIGFKYIFNLTNRLFLGLKIESISGNWRDFTLKNIHYDILGASIQAQNIHLILDTKSFFNISAIFKKIDTEKLVISLNNNIINKPIEKNTINDFIEKKIFVKYPIIFEKIHADTILFKLPKFNIFVSNFLSSIKLIGNNINFSPTYIDNIRILLVETDYKKKNTRNKFNFKNGILQLKNIHSLLHFLPKNRKFFIPFNVDLKFLKCKKINFINYKEINSFQTELEAKIEDNLLQIKKLKINSSLLSIVSYGKIIFNNEHSISCIINNAILMPKFNKKRINILFSAHLNNKFTFYLKSNDSHKINIHGKILLDSLKHPFSIKLNIKDFLWSVKKNYFLRLKYFNIILKGKTSNYSFYLKNIFSVRGMPSIFVDINGYGDLKKIYLKKIKFLPLRKNTFYKKIIHLQNNIKYNEYLLELIGNINISGKINHNIYNFYIPKINLDGNIMKKKISILGSLYYKNFNFLKIPRINIFLGKNKLYLNGSLGKKCNIYSSMFADDLNYFIPNLKGKIKAKANFFGNYISPIITSRISMDHLKLDSIFFKNISIFTVMNFENSFSGDLLVNAKKIQFSDFHIDFLKIHLCWDDKRKNFSFLLKSDLFYINLLLNSFINYKTGNSYSFFKEIKVKTVLGQFTTKKHFPVFYWNSKNKINNLYSSHLKIKNIVSSFLDKTKTSLFKIFNESRINFSSKLSVNTKFKWISGNEISEAHIFLTTKNMILEKKMNKKIFFENIDYLKFSIKLIKDKIKSKLMIKKFINSLKQSNISGYLDICDIYNQRNMEGKFIVDDLSISFLNFFTQDYNRINGLIKGDVKFFGSFYQPKISADISLNNIFIKSNNILKYMTLFFPYFLSRVENIKINQEITIKKGSISFNLNSFFKNDCGLEWNILFNSNTISIAIFPKIKVQFSSQLNLHYLLSKYDLIGYIKFALFYFKINEKNFVF